MQQSLNFSARINNLIANSPALQALPNFSSNPDNFTIQEKNDFIEGFVTYADENLHQIKEVASSLPLAWIKGYANVLLLGNPGYAKSQLTEMFYDYLVVTGQISENYYFVQSLSSGTTVDQILGGVKMKEFTKEGDIFYKWDNSFGVHPYACLEEVFQAQTTALLSLKDTLMSRKLRNGVQQEELKTRLLVCNSNQLREEVVENADHLAFFDRFQFELTVGWSSWEQNDYTIAACKGLKVNKDHKYYHLLVQICWAAAVQSKKNMDKGELPISPRNVIRAVDCALCFGNINCLRFTYDFIPVLDDLTNHTSAISSTEKERLQILEKWELFEKMTPKTIVYKYKDLFEVMDWLEESTFEDGNTTLVTELSEKAEPIIKEKFEVIKGLITTHGSASLKKVLKECDITNDDIEVTDEESAHVSNIFTHKDFAKIEGMLN